MRKLEAVHMNLLIKISSTLRTASCAPPQNVPPPLTLWAEGEGDVRSLLYFVSSLLLQRAVLSILSEEFTNMKEIRFCLAGPH